MAIDFTMPPHVLEIRDKVRAFIKEEIEPAEAAMRKNGNWRDGIVEMRRKAKQRGLWLPHMPKEFGGHGFSLGEYAMVGAEIGKYCGATALTFNMHNSSMMWSRLNLILSSGSRRGIPTGVFDSFPTIRRFRPLHPSYPAPSACLYDGD